MIVKEHECLETKITIIRIIYDDYWHDGWVLKYGDYTWERVDDINYCPFCGVKL